MEDPRIVSQKILLEFFTTKKRLSVITANIIASKSLKSKEINRIYALTRDVIRWKGRLDYWIDSALDRPLSTLDNSLKVLLRISVYELLMDDTVPDYAAIDSWVNIARKSIGEKVTGITNAILRSLSKIETSKPLNGIKSESVLAEWLCFPDWMIKRWISQFGKSSTRELCETFNEIHEYTIRIKYPESSMSEITHRCKEDGIKLCAAEASTRFFKVKAGFNLLAQHPLFLDGSISIQDRAAGIAVDLLNPVPGETILDVCGAPGTKALYIAELMEDTGRILASDPDSARVKLGITDMLRHKLKSIEWNVKDATKDEFELADGILIDAPCTGTGVIGKHPDIKWRRTMVNIHEMANIQLAILNHVSNYLKPGGRLVYSTCSLEPEENWNVINAFLKLSPKFELDMNTLDEHNHWVDSHGTLQTLPHRDKTDGMYAARLIKN